ncbi:MAG: hypothetical protein V1933_00580 [Candidatus Omnitrophota bacterium]
MAEQKKGSKKIDVEKELKKLSSATIEKVLDQGSEESYGPPISRPFGTLGGACA